jgi:hypothetical protein
MNEVMWRIPHTNEFKTEHELTREELVAVIRDLQRRLCEIEKGVSEMISMTRKHETRLKLRVV